jgi:sugar O-acyltransferase (sialic acid O-acetyltransferase NeuD family)
MKKPVTLLIGAGGHACALLDIIKLTDCATLCGLLDSSNEGTERYGLKILGNDDLLPRLFKMGVTHFILGIGSAGYNPLRKQLFDKARQVGLTPLTLKHPSAIVSPTAIIDPGAQLMAGCIIGPEAQVGTNTIINSGAIIEHQSKVSCHTHIASGACLAGNVTVGEESFIGAKSVVRQGLTIGSYCTVGMGSVVTRSFPDHSTAYGIPAREIKTPGVGEEPFH